MFRKLAVLSIMTVLLIMSGACGRDKGPEATPKMPISSPADLPANTPESSSPAEAAAAKVQANEIGRVMILMYHVIGAEKEGDWAQTGANFLRDLGMLYEQGYSLVGLNDFLENNIAVPAGRSPVIITFDDGTKGHFNYVADEQGAEKIDPQSAAGMLLDFAEGHPEFGRRAVFFINDRPFGAGQDWRKKLRSLAELGFEIGNHTLTHPRLDRISDEEVQRELAALAKLVEDTVPGYQVRALALPFGIMPQNPGLASEGSHEGYTYGHAAVLRVGANPALSPNRVGFDPLRLPRVQASTAELTKWLRYFQNNPEERYISDGDPLTVAVPQEKKELVALETLGNKTLILWQGEGASNFGPDKVK